MSDDTKALMEWCQECHLTAGVHKATCSHTKPRTEGDCKACKGSGLGRVDDNSGHEHLIACPRCGGSGNETDTKALIERLRSRAWEHRNHRGLRDEAADAIERLEHDAARYRWLRQNPTYMGWEHDFEPDHIDRVIDEEMAETEGR